MEGGRDQTEVPPSPGKEVGETPSKEGEGQDEGEAMLVGGATEEAAQEAVEGKGPAPPLEPIPVYTKFLALDKPLPRKRFLQVSIIVLIVIAD